jgi:hypothetical protein
VHGASIGGSESEGGLEAAERVGRISTESARDSTASSSSAGGGALAKIPAGLVVDEANVEVRSRISSGQFGDVYQGHWQGTDVAVKFIKCGNVHGEQQRCDALRRPACQNTGANGLCVSNHGVVFKLRWLHFTRLRSPGGVAQHHRRLRKRGQPDGDTAPSECVSVQRSLWAFSQLAAVQCRAALTAHHLVADICLLMGASMRYPKLCIITELCHRCGTAAHFT